MPTDKQKPGPPAKPFTPTLSSNFRTTKSPLTPRIAGSVHSTPVSSPRRGLQTAPTASPTVTPRNVLSTPTASQHNGNITPRSGVRKSRAFDSPSTPNGTAPSNLAPRLPPNAPVDRGLPVVYDGPGLGIHSPQSQSSVDDSHFFHADDAKSSISSYDLEERPKVPVKKNTFFYASGGPDQGGAPDQVGHGVGVARLGNDQGKSLLASKSTTGSITRSPPSSASSPHLPSPDISRLAPLRPPSPLKESNAPILPHRQPVKSATVSSISSHTAKSTNPLQRPRQASIGRKLPASTPPGHRKSLSNASQHSVGGDSRIKSRPSSSSSAVQFGTAAAPASPLIKPADIVTVPKRRSLAFAPEQDAPPISPTKSEAPVPSQLQKANDLAANARRERKVLDLEISNSSLLAINRTLEREMRKQSAELRRFRRLSKAGRLSVVAGSTRSVSGQSALSTLEESDDERASDVDDMSEEEEEEDLESSLEDSQILDLSPEERAEQDTRRRIRDEKRLHLDLSQHRQLLIDSQKMNQSIRRCVAWTDDLITEGKKALAYQVRVSDVELGGRVLAVEDDVVETRKGLLSPSATIGLYEESQMWADQLQDILEGSNSGQEALCNQEVT